MRFKYRLNLDYGLVPETPGSLIYTAMIQLILRRLVSYCFI